jgi:hypothetical protein
VSAISEPRHLTSGTPAALSRRGAIVRGKREAAGSHWRLVVLSLLPREERMGFGLLEMVALAFERPLWRDAPGVSRGIIG